MIMMIRKELACLVCGNIQEIQRVASKNKKVGHEKKLWCPTCHKKRKHVELPKFKQADEYNPQVKNATILREI